MYPAKYHGTLIQITSSLRTNMIFSVVYHVRLNSSPSSMHEWASVLNVHGQVDVVFLDFAKAFDSVPHEWLLLKAAYYGIRTRLTPGFEAF